MGNLSRNENDIRGKLALITGASGGIGSACADRFAQSGTHLALCYGSNKDKLLEIIKNLGEKYPINLIEKGSKIANGETHKEGNIINISFHQADLSIADDIINLVKEASEAHGRSGIDILVSNAGYGKRITDIWEIPLSEFDKTLNINLRASFILTKAIVPYMKEQKWGRLIYVSSIAAYGGGINGCHYAASKGGLSSMMKNLSSKLAPYNISANDVAPAMVGSTGMIQSPDSVPGLVESIPLHRLCEPQEVAEAVHMYAITGYITGQSLLMSGGLK